MVKHIFVVNGAGGVGKDTVIKLIRKCCGKKVLNFSTIDQVKAELRKPSPETISFLGLTEPWDGISKSDYWRNCMVKLKELHTSQDNRPNRYAIKKVSKSNDDIAFIHVREPENIDYLKQHLPQIQTLLITRKQAPIPDNKVDSGVFDYQYDLEIKNDFETVEELREYLTEFVKEQGLIK
jgi:hypothetical protein